MTNAGKEVIFMVDGCLNAFEDDVMACGARGIISEPYTDYKTIARRYKNCFIAGEGDSRILLRNNPAEICAMVENMLETGRMSGGYMMCIGNHITLERAAGCGETVFRFISRSDIADHDRTRI